MRFGVVAVAFLLGAVGSCLGQTARAAAARPIQIAAQPLASALRALGRELGLQIVYRSDVVGELDSPGVDGELTVDDALSALLAGTKLTYRYLDARTVTIVPQSASGRDAASNAAVAGADTRHVELDEIIVTAQKVAEAASRTPIALSVHTGDSLRRSGVVSIQDLQSSEPALQVGLSPAGVNISLRGVATTDVTSKGDQGIVFNIDGVPVGRPRQMGLSFFDLERVEILRGPQGTLYGKSATGGAINLITNRPQDTFDAAAHVEFGSFNTRRGDAMLNEPISATFALRAAASFNIHDGFLNPVLGNYRPTDRPRRRQDQDDATGRVSGLWSIGDGGSLLLTGTFGQVEGVGANYTALLDSVLTRHGSAAREVYYNPMGGSVDDHFRNVNAELKLDLGHLQLTYVGARMRYQARDQDRVSGNDPAANGGGNYNWRNYIGDYTTDSHELRLSNAEAQRMEWVAGYNYNNEFIEEHDQSWTTPITNPVLSSSANNVAIIANTVHGSDGIFGQINFHATDALRLTLGIRRSSDRVRRRGTIAAGPGPWIDSRGNSPCVALNDCIGAPDNGDQSAAKFTYRVGSDYQITGNQMLYASVATGYKAGGFNDYEPTSGRVASYEPEQLTAYEAGYKGRLLPNLQFDSAAYYYDYSKNQVTQVVGIFNLSPPVIVIYTKTVPTVFYGWESELHFKMTARDFIDLEIALERNYYKHLQAGFNYLAQTDWSGYRLDNTPTAAATLAYSHRWLPESGGYWEAHVSSKYSSGYLLSDFQQPRQYVQAPFTRSDFTLTYGSDSGKVEVQVYARNIEDRLQLLSPPQNVVPAVVNAANVGVSEPRTVGVRIGIRY